MAQLAPAGSTTLANGKEIVLRSLVERCTFGFTQEEWTRAKALGSKGYLEYHLAWQSIDDSLLDARLALLPAIAWTPQQVADNTANHNPVQELKHAAILRAVYSKRQLLERVVEFWTDHFNIYIKDGSVRMLKPTDERDVIRKFALGKFSDLLKASMRSAAMLMHLDNDENSKFGPNENYARELMELHTLGVDGGYTEDDVKEAARCLTGWRFMPLGSGVFGTFVFVPSTHDYGAKQVLGHAFPSGQGIQDGDQLADLLLAHPSTPRFVGRKLARHLLRYEPSSQLVDRVVKEWQQTGGDIKALIRVILDPGTLELEQPWVHRKLRRPFHFAAWLMRVVGADIPIPAPLMSAGPMTNELRLLGQEPYDWPMPNGYPDNAAAWGGALLSRWSFASRLLDGSLPGAVVAPAMVLNQLVAVGGSTWSEAIDRMLSGGRMTDQERRLIDVYAATSGSASWSQIAELIALAASCESLQYY